MFIRKKTKAKIKFSLILSSILLVAILISLYINGNRKHGAVIAEINGKSMYLDDILKRISFVIDEEINQETINSVPKEVLEAILVESYVRDEVYEKALDENLGKDEKIQEAVEQYRKQLIIDEFIDRASKQAVTEDKVREKYNELSELLSQKEERKVKHILVDSKLKAKRVIRNIKRTGSFEKIAKRKSLDKETAEKGGEIGYVLEEQLDPTFAKIAFILEEGVLSKPVETKYGWHIIKVDDIRKAKPAEYEEVKEQIKLGLIDQAKQDFLYSISENLDLNILIELDNETEEYEEGFVEEDVLVDEEDGKSIFGDNVENEPSYADDKMKREVEAEKAKARARARAKKNAQRKKAETLKKTEEKKKAKELKKESEGKEKLDEKIKNEVEKNKELKKEAEDAKKEEEKKKAEEKEIKNEVDKASDLIKEKDAQKLEDEEVELPAIL